MDEEFDRLLDTDDYRFHDKYFKSFPEFATILEYIKRRNPSDVAANPELYTLDRYPLKKVKAFFGDYKCEWAQGMEVEPLTEEEYNLLTQVRNTT